MKNFTPLPHRKKFLVFFFLLVIPLIVFNCKDKFQPDEILIESTSVNSSNSLSNAKINYSDNEMVLGKKLQNPFTIANMETAQKNLLTKGIKNENKKIEANYLYIRFLPKTDSEYNTINADSTIDVFEYPLDYEIIKNGNKYKDKTLLNDKFTYLYTTIPVENKKNFKIKFEILEELFLPFGNGKNDAQARSTDMDYLKHLEKEALFISGNASKNSKNAKVADWYSSGRIRVWDDAINYNYGTNQYNNGAGFVPVPGCMVRANRWFTTKTTIADNIGNFFINHGWGNGDEVNYSIKWERGNFDIRDGSYGQAYFNGPKILYQWNLDIGEVGTPDSYIYAHVHRAAWNYFYNNTFGVISPPTGLHLGAKQGSGRSHYFQFNGTWLASEIKLIFDLGNDNSREIFGTTIHELTHATHWMFGMSYSAYCTNANQAGRLAESYAQAVGWHITRIVYGFGPNPIDILNDFDNEQGIPLASFNGGSCFSNAPWYTPLFIDLIDNFNQSTIFGPNNPDDQANGYNITELQYFLANEPTNWYKYREFLQNNSSNPTEANASQLFSDYD